MSTGGGTWDGMGRETLQANREKGCSELARYREYQQGASLFVREKLQFQLCRELCTFSVVGCDEWSRRTVLMSIVPSPPFSWFSAAKLAVGKSFWGGSFFAAVHQEV